ncbi:MAG: DUF421 domain-containing protein [Bacillota bacterium]|nr:DUF421 domain-containing protein [Bacillota bacterium]
MSTGKLSLLMFGRSLLFFAVLLILVRLMGKREVSSLTPMDLVIFLMVADAAVITIEDEKMPVLAGLVPVVTLALIQILLSWAMLKSRGLRRLLGGMPSVVIRQGVVQMEELSRQRMNLDELLSHLRLQNMPRVEDVEYAVLEPSGRLSVVPKSMARPVRTQDLKLAPPEEDLPEPVIMDGELVFSSLKKHGWTPENLRRILEENGVRSEKEILLGLWDGQGHLFIQERGRQGQRTPSPRILSIPK